MFFQVFIPLKVESKNDVYLYVGGETVGLKIQSGLEVVSIYSVNGKSPAYDAGISESDQIISLNDVFVSSSKEFKNIINRSNGKSIKVDLKRNNVYMTVYLTPILIGNEYVCGIHLKEESLGIGTLTYVVPNTLEFGALGHNFISYIGETHGTLNQVKLTNIKKAKIGEAGEKQAEFSSNVLGEISINDSVGVFGKLYSNNVVEEKKLMKVGTQKSIKLGKAYIYSNMSKDTIGKYEIQITEVNYQLTKGSQGIKFKVVDEELLNISGGVVRGMSGSPIVQNDQIIGAVSHVILKKPDEGYGMHIEFMLMNHYN